VQPWFLEDGVFCKYHSYERKGFPSTSVAAWRGKVSWPSGAKDYLKVTPHNTLHTRDLLVGKPGKVAGSAQARSSRELKTGFIQNRGQGRGRASQGRAFRGGVFQGGDWWV